MADDAEHPVPALDRRLDLLGDGHCHVGIRLVVQCDHLHLVAEQPAGAVELLGHQPHATGNGLARVGLEAGQRPRDVDGQIAFGRRAGRRRRPGPKQELLTASQKCDASSVHPFRHQPAYLAKPARTRRLLTGLSQSRNEIRDGHLTARTPACREQSWSSSLKTPQSRRTPRSTTPPGLAAPLLRHECRRAAGRPGRSRHPCC